MTRDRAQTTISAVQHRRSIREFSSKPISPALLEDLLTDATRAPTAGNLQNYAMIATEALDQKRELRKIHGDQPFLESAALVLTFCVDVSRTSRWLETEKISSGFDNLWGFLMGFSDAWCASQTLALSAEARGLGTCYSGVTYSKTLELIDWLNCPRGVLPVVTLAVGYPQVPRESEVVRSHFRPRFSISSIYHRDRYRSHDTQAIRELFAGREDDETEFYREFYREFNDDVGRSTLAQFYGNRKYPKSATDLSSLNFFRALARQGFIDVG